MSLGKERGEKLKQQEAAAQAKREWQLQRMPILKARADQLWESLIACVRSEVNDFNASLADHPQRHLKCDASANSIEVRKFKYPQEHLTAELDIPAQTISITRISTPAVGDGPRYQAKDSIALRLDDDNVLYMHHSSRLIDQDAAVAILLEHMMK